MCVLLCSLLAVTCVPPLHTHTHTHTHQTSQDELSAEDDSVNRVASMITTLQYEACTSPVCERGVVSVLMTAVGKRHIDEDLVSKVIVVPY